MTTYSYYPPDVLPPDFCITSGANDLLTTADGRQYIDLLSGSGTVFLGHGNRAIAKRLQSELESVWNAGALRTSARDQAWAAVESFFPDSYELAVLYSTGMEAVEFAIRVARQSTGRREIVGFNGSMHGKSMATARLGWPNKLVTLPDFHSLQYLPELAEDQILANVRDVVSTERVAAVFLEGLLGSKGGHIPSPEFARELAKICADRGTLLVADEIFTGFYRTGAPFLHHALGLTPDVVLIGKAMGNGFPVAGVVVQRRYPVQGSMLPGSTFAGNPLASSVVTATLAEMRAQDLPTKVGAIEREVRGKLTGLSSMGIALRGKGALWLLEFPASLSVQRIMQHIVRDGVIVSPTANYIRMLPAATITLAHLTKACEVIVTACEKERDSAR
ncbi:MAG TPA: aminotransferase class III-fold pyridoxal phosphate-dependent enzyme [Gemmatimonadaceae bacterium]|nr:aminotransferase class III-fold pyridoxal phosphate-dependent enzyme [Gemmatimonadaceae bacterium]